MIRLIAVSVVVITALTDRASAQSSADAFQVGAQLTVARSGQFESTELGIGGRVSWHPVALLGFESEIDLYPADFPSDGVPFSTRRVEGLFGVTAGPRLARLRPFAGSAPAFSATARRPKALRVSRFFRHR